MQPIRKIKDSPAQTVQTVANAIRRAPTKRYIDYMRSPQWKQIRIEYLEAVEYWCEICRKAKACQCHHVTYERLGWERPGDLVAVCVNCHHKIHCKVSDMACPANDNKQIDMFPVAAGK